MHPIPWGGGTLNPHAFLYRASISMRHTLPDALCVNLHPRVGEHIQSVILRFCPIYLPHGKYFHFPKIPATFFSIVEKL